MKYEGWIENYSFSEIRYKILIRRKPLFVIQNCVIPVINKIRVFSQNYL